MSSSSTSPAPPTFTLAALSTGLVAALVGYAGSIAVVLAAAEAVRATPIETVSWVTATCLAMAVTTAILTLAYRIPITTAWSTPGAAVIAATTGVTMPEAVGAFLVAGGLIVMTALVRPLGALIARIPLPVASGMLAGVLLKFVIAAFESIPVKPALVLPMIALYLVMRILHPSTAALVILVAGIALAHALGYAPRSVALEITQLTVISPVFDMAVLVGVAVPLYLVTMASQNLAGAAVLRSAGYTVPFNAALGVTGVTSVLIAPFGGHTVNLSAISAALCTGPDTHADPARRWPSGIALALTYALITVFAGSLVALFLSFPPELMRTVAGLALLTSLIGALTSATADSVSRFSAVLAFAVTASGVTIAGIGAPFWGLVAGLCTYALERGFVGQVR